MRKTILGNLMLGFIILGAVCAIVLIANMNPTVIVTTMGQKGWNNFALGEGNPGSGAGGVLEIYNYPHQAVPGTAYASNLSTVTAYAYSDNLNSALTGNVPPSTTFDLVIKCRANATQAYNVTSASWMLTWLRANLTCANLGIGALTAMTRVEIAHTATYIWFNCYINNGGAGYTITPSQHVNVTLFRLQYWG